MQRRRLLLGLSAVGSFLFASKLVMAQSPAPRGYKRIPEENPRRNDTVSKSSTEWRQLLSDAEYRVLRDHGTERAFTSPLNDEKRPGVFACRGCGLPLFRSQDKFDSGTGWPSFFDTIAPDVIAYHVDRSFFMTRVETRCARCDGHLGHVFDDGPQPTGLRFCMNGVALQFVPGETDN